MTASSETITFSSDTGPSTHCFLCSHRKSFCFFILVPTLQVMFNDCLCRLLDDAKQSFSASCQEVASAREDNVGHQGAPSLPAPLLIWKPILLLHADAQWSQQALHHQVERCLAHLLSMFGDLVESKSLCTCFLEPRILLASKVLAQHHCGQCWVSPSPTLLQLAVAVKPCQMPASDPKRLQKPHVISPTVVHLVTQVFVLLRSRMHTYPSPYPKRTEFVDSQVLQTRCNRARHTIPLGQCAVNAYSSGLSFEL